MFDNENGLDNNENNVYNNSENVNTGFTLVNEESSQGSTGVEGNSAYNNAGYDSNVGYNNTGYDSNTGYNNTGYDSNIGYNNTGYDSNSGYNNTGYDSNTGYNNAGTDSYNSNSYNQNGYSQNYGSTQQDNSNMNYNSQYQNGYNQQNRYNQQNNGYYYNNNQSWGNNAGHNSSAGNKPKKSGNGIAKKIAALVASAAIFGVVAGGVMYGVYYTGTSIYQVNNNSKVDLPITSTSINSTTSSVSEDAEGVMAKMDVAAVADACMPAMVALEGTVTVTSNSFWGAFGGQSYEAATSGTGIIVSKNDTELLLLTNAHVVEDVNNLKCVFVDGEKVDCVVKGMKTDKDIAVVAVNLSNIKSETMSNIAIAELGSSEDVVLGQEVVAIGNALGEGQSVTNGIISALNRSITVDNVTFEGLFMTNAAINSGNSGGALLNADGKVIGINFAKTSESGVEGMAYAIPVSTVRDLIDSLMNRETRTKVDESERGYLGIAGMDITNEMATYYKYPQGLLLTTVEENSAADKAGLTKNDIIVGFDEQTVASMSGLQTIMQYYKSGETVTIEYYHLEGNQYVLKNTQITLDKRN